MISVFIRTIIIYLFLSFLLKIMGKRQIGELEVSELVSTLLISEIAAIPISDPSIPLSYAIVPGLFIAFLEIALAAMKNKSQALKRVIEGEPVYIVFRGTLCQSALLKNRISINEVLAEMRISGIASLSEVYYAILEQNGKLSFVKEEEKDTVSHPVIIDGALDKKRLKLIGLDEDWIREQLGRAELSPDEVFLLSVSDDGNINIIRKEIP